MPSSIYVPYIHLDALEKDMDSLLLPRMWVNLYNLSPKNIITIKTYFLTLNNLQNMVSHCKTIFFSLCLFPPSFRYYSSYTVNSILFHSPLIQDFHPHLHFLSFYFSGLPYFSFIPRLIIYISTLASFAIFFRSVFQLLIHPHFLQSTFHYFPYTFSLFSIHLFSYFTVFIQSFCLRHQIS